MSRNGRKKSRPAGADGNGSGSGSGTDRVEYVSISEETRRRYLNYAISVITSRALPDVRDGLKPVQRRILYVMYDGLRLTADSKSRKCAKIIGDTTGNYHPHGPMAVYEALVRLGQDFTLRYPLLIGQGNFGSVMGLKAAAERYTEAKLSEIAEQLLEELRFHTVDMRPNYDATRDEPVVLPSRFPNLLVNGTQGIAVGMATSIPPHNLGEVIRACVFLIDNPGASTARLMKSIKGPDFPLGGRIVTDRTELREAYETGRGSIKTRGEWRFDREKRRQIRTRLIVHSVPWGVTTGPLLTDINELVDSRKLPQLESVTDETSEDNGLRIVLEIKSDSDPEAVMAYLYRHTSLEQNIGYNATCLVPDDQGVLVPSVLSLTELLTYFLEFRFETVRRRFLYQLRQLERRIHMLEGFAIVFDGLDKALRIIRRSRGRSDAATKLMKTFPLDEDQTSAVLDLALYRISQLEIDRILEELDVKRAEADRIRRLLASKKRLWTVVRRELEDVSKQFADKRRTSLGSAEEIMDFDPQDYIVRENTHVVVTCDGWIKRVGRLAKVENTRVREGDQVLQVVPGNTLDNVVFFSSHGVAWTLPIDLIPVSSGYGEPLAKHVKMGDGATIVASLTTDDRFTPSDRKVRRQPVPSPLVVVVTVTGQVMRVSLSTFRTGSTKAGRRYCRLRAGDRVVFVELVDDAETMFIASRNSRIIHFAIDDVPILSGPGLGVRGLQLEDNDAVLGAVQLCRPSDCLRVRNTNDKMLSFGQMKYGITARGGKGVRTSMRNGFEQIVVPVAEPVDWSTIGDD